MPRRQPSHAAAGAAALALFCALAGEARAELITLQFKATVTSASGPDNPGVNAGDTVTGVISYESSLTDQDVNPLKGVYSSNPLASNMSLAVAVGSVNYATDPAQDFGAGEGASITVENSLSDSFVFEVIDKQNLGSFEGSAATFVELRFSLVDSSGAAFSSDALPASLDLASFNDVQFSFAAGNSEGTRFDLAATITELTVATAAIPEPSSLCILGVAAISVIGYARRRRQRLDSGAPSCGRVS